MKVPLQHDLINPQIFSATGRDAGSARMELELELGLTENMEYICKFATQWEGEISVCTWTNLLQTRHQGLTPISSCISCLR